MMMGVKPSVQFTNYKRNTKATITACLSRFLRKEFSKDSAPQTRAQTRFVLLYERIILATLTVYRLVSCKRT